MNSSSNPQLSSRGGFTLVEALAVAIVVGLLVAIVVGRTAGVSNRAAVAAAADELRSANSLARTVAIQNGRTAQLRVDSPGDKFWVEVRMARSSALSAPACSRRRK